MEAAAEGGVGLCFPRLMCRIALSEGRRSTLLSRSLLWLSGHFPRALLGVIKKIVVVVMMFREIGVVAARHFVAIGVVHYVVIRAVRAKPYFSKTSLSVLQRPNSSGPFTLDLLHHFHYPMR